MLLARVRFDNNIVHIYLHVPPDHVMENVIHQVLISSSSVFEAERHDLVEKIAEVRSKCCLFSVMVMHLDLIIS